MYFNNETRHALWLSVERYLQKWEDCRDGKWDDIPAGEAPVYDLDCPLCNLFNTNAYADDACQMCPVMWETGLDQCQETPWVEVRRCDQLGSRVQRMLDALEAEYRFLLDIALSDDAITW